MEEVKKNTESATNGTNENITAMTEANKDQLPNVNGLNPLTMTEDKKDIEPLTSDTTAHLTPNPKIPSSPDSTNDNASTSTPATSTPPSPATSKDINAWTAPGPAAFDFRSDTVTSPTASMLLATTRTTLLDDVFHEDPTTNELETYVAGLIGKEAGVFVISGTMGNQLSVRTHLGGPPHSILADTRSHIIGWEAGGIASLSGAMPIPVSPTNNHHLTLADIKAHTITSTDSHFCPTRLICLENTLAGTILPLSDCQTISSWAHAQDPPILMHLDGARLWEAVAAGAGTLQEYSACFDSVTMCFSKGLGAPIGSIICASTSFVQKARHLRKMMGGGFRQAGVVTAAARVAVEETFLGGKLEGTHVRAKEVARMWEGRGGRLEQPVETNMVWLDLEGVGVEEVVEVGVKEGLKMLGGRVVVHYQIGDEAVVRLGRVMDAILRIGREKVGEVAKGAKDDLEVKDAGHFTNGVEKAPKAPEKDIAQVTNEIKEKAAENMAPKME